MEPLLRRMACWCVILLGFVVVVLTGTFALEASVGIVEPLHPPESAIWRLVRSASGRRKSSKATASHLQKVALLPKLSWRECKWTKGLPKWMRPESLSKGVSTSPPALALRVMADPAHQQMAAALTALADEHRAAKQKEMPLARRAQQLDIKIEKKKRAVDSLEATHRALSHFIQHLQTLLQNTSKQVQDAKTELAQFQTERSEVVNGSSSSEEQNDIEVLLRRSMPQPDETLSQQMEAVVRAAAAFRTRSSGHSAAEPMHQDLHEAQEEDGCRKRLPTRSQRSRCSRSR